MKRLISIFSIWLCLTFPTFAGAVYGPVDFYRDISVQTFPSVSNVFLTTTTNGIWTNVLVTNTFCYRVYGTNGLGRTPTPASSSCIAFGPTTNGTSNAVTIAWNAVDGVRGYVVEKSWDLGITYTNYSEVNSSTTNLTDLGTNITWTAGTFSSIETQMPLPNIDFSGAGTINIPVVLTESDTVDQVSSRGAWTTNGIQISNVLEIATHNGSTGGIARFISAGYATTDLHAIDNTHLAIGQNRIVTEGGGAITSGGFTNAMPSYLDLIHFSQLTTTNNIQTGDFAVAVFGQANVASNAYAYVGSGYGNLATSTYAVVSGGESNTARGSHTVVGGGAANEAQGAFAQVGGGFDNDAEGSYSVVVAGRSARAGNSAVAIGNFAVATNSGSVVISDASGTGSISNDSVMIKGNGGIYFRVNDGPIQVNETNTVVYLKIEPYSVLYFDSQGIPRPLPNGANGLSLISSGTNGNPGWGIPALNVSNTTISSFADVATNPPLNDWVLHYDLASTNWTPIHWSNLLNGADLLPLIMTVDGPGSGLNADQLDGAELSDLIQTSGGTMTENLVMNSGDLVFFTTNGIIFEASGQAQGMYGDGVGGIEVRPEASTNVTFKVDGYVNATEGYVANGILGATTNLTFRSSIETQIVYVVGGIVTSNAYQ